jgi:hypothetical protein
MKRRKPRISPKNVKPPKNVNTVKFDQKKEVRAIARERVGAVKPAQTIQPKTLRKKPKHKKPPTLADE